MTRLFNLRASDLNDIQILRRMTNVQVLNLRLVGYGFNEVKLSTALKTNNYYTCTIVIFINKAVIFIATFILKLQYGTKVM